MIFLRLCVASLCALIRLVLLGSRQPRSDHSLNIANGDNEGFDPAPAADLKVNGAQRIFGREPRGC